MEINIRHVHVGAEIEKRRVELGLSKSELGRRIGVPQQHVNRILERETMETSRLVKVLNKPGKLTNEECDIMKKHTVWGGEILEGLEFLPQADLGAIYHMGSGRPQRCHNRRYR